MTCQALVVEKAVMAAKDSSRCAFMGSVYAEPHRYTASRYYAQSGPTPTRSAHTAQPNLDQAWKRGSFGTGSFGTAEITTIGNAAHLQRLDEWARPRTPAPDLVSILVGRPGATNLEVDLTSDLFFNFFTSSCHPIPGWIVGIASGMAG